MQQSHAAEKNIIFFITDDESPTLGCYGDPVAVTPAIDALAADGTLFTHAFATTA
ncbi:MAG TPA: heparan N-sulfatase, partial [Planctomycetaceae bacterium]|nr:heparan N-sulfatase [Planctomycetaceae bacterium]